MTSTPAADPAAGSRRSAVRTWAVGLLFSALMIFASVLDMRTWPDTEISPATVLGAIAFMAGHGLFMAEDLRRRGRVPGWWPYAGAVCPPLVFWFYLAAEYRLHAFWQVPLSVFAYLGMGAAASVIGAG